MESKDGQRIHEHPLTGYKKQLKVTQIDANSLKRECGGHNQVSNGQLTSLGLISEVLGICLAILGAHARR